MTMRTGRIVLFILAPLLILMLPLAVYLSDRSTNTGALPRNVAIAGVDVAGLQPDEALTVVRAYHNDLYGETSRFVVNGRTFELSPAEVGMTIDANSALTEAIASDDHGFLEGIIPWLRSFSSGTNVTVPITVNGQAIDDYLDRWESQAIPVPAFDGGIEIIDRKVQVEYPKSGLRIDRDTARGIVQTTLIAGQHDDVEIPLLDLPPVLSNAELDAAAATVESLIDRPVTLHDAENDATLIILPSEIAAAVTIDIVTTMPAHIDIGLDPEIITTTLESRLAEFEQPAVEVQIETSVASSRATVTLPENGTRVDVDALTEALYNAALNEGRGVLPIVDDVEPSITVEEVEAWGPLSLVSSFTTR